MADMKQSGTVNRKGPGQYLAPKEMPLGTYFLSIVPTFHSSTTSHSDFEFIGELNHSLGWSSHNPIISGNALTIPEVHFTNLGISQSNQS
jgi:hypothetical protein